MLPRKNLLVLVKHFLQIGEGDLWLAGLDYTSEGEKFGEFARCFPYAHRIIKLRAYCSTPGCLYPASMTHHEGQKDGEVKVGDDGYSPMCGFCWEKSSGHPPTEERYKEGSLQIKFV